MLKLRQAFVLFFGRRRSGYPGETVSSLRSEYFDSSPDTVWSQWHTSGTPIIVVTACTVVEGWMSCAG